MATEENGMFPYGQAVHQEQGQTGRPTDEMTEEEEEDGQFGQAGPQGYGQAKREMIKERKEEEADSSNWVSGNHSTPGGGASSDRVVLPEVEEVFALRELETNFEQTEKYIETFDNEKKTINDTRGLCEEVVRAEFERLHKILKQREETLLSELEERFAKRESSIVYQTDLLVKHGDNYRDTLQKCKEIISSNQSRSERKGRVAKVVSLCKDCVEASPVLKAVPIDLEFRFSSQRDVTSSLNTYGNLKFTKMERGRARKFTGKKYGVSQEDYIIGEKQESKSYNRQRNNNSKARIVEQKTPEPSNDYIQVDRDEVTQVDKYNEMASGENSNNSNNSNNVNNENNDGDSIDMGSLLTKVKVSLDLYDGNDLVKAAKPTSLRYEPGKNKNDYESMDTLTRAAKAGIAVKLKIKKDDIKDNELTITAIDSGKEISNVNDMIKYIGLAAKDEKTAVGVKVVYNH